MYLLLPYQVTDEQRSQLEYATRQQSTSQLWHSERKPRLTASKFGEIRQLTARRNLDKFCNYMCTTQKFHCKPMLHGIQYEKIAIDKFTATSNIVVQPCGLFVSKEFPYLAATPDGLIGDNNILEVKCPYSGRSEKISVGPLFPYLEMIEGKLNLKKSHRYYDQIQGQLFITNRVKCILLIYTFVDMKMLYIPIDKEYCQYSLVPTLTTFYFKHYLPFIAHKLALNELY